MMTKNSFCLLALTITLSNCKDEIQREDRIPAKDSVKTISIDTNIVKLGMQSPLDYLLTTFADSINNIDKYGRIPDFAEDESLDSRYSYYEGDFHHPPPIRKRILDSVSNCNSLLLILKDRSGKYKVKPTTEFEGDESLRLSFYDLALKRYKQLNCQDTKK